MLRDPKARRLATEFFGQWLGFYQFDRTAASIRERFPEFNDALKAAMYDEAVSFFEHIVREDRPVSEILFADYAFLNRELAEHYGIEQRTLADERLARVEDVGKHHRGGLLGLGAVLTVTSAPLRTSPVKRGDWVLRRVLGTPVPPPPADAGSIPADDVLADGLTVRAAAGSPSPATRRASTATRGSTRSALPWSTTIRSAAGASTYRDGAADRPVGHAAATARRSPAWTACGLSWRAKSSSSSARCAASCWAMPWGGASRSRISS